MRNAFKLAYRNLIGAGLRTWLNAIVLSFAFIAIIGFNGLMDGWQQFSIKESIVWQFANGHLYHKAYEPNDPYSIKDGHGIIKNTQNLTPILIRQASIYPNGRMISILLKGIDSKQTTLKLPTELLNNTDAEIPAIIGKRMANAAKLKQGDQVLLRWRDKNGTFDAANITIAGVFDTDVGAVDNAQIWVSIEKLWAMTGLNNHASFYVANNDYNATENKNWRFEDQEELLANFYEMMKTERISGAIFYVVLLAIALLAIFDTQVLSIFRRQKEIGTYIALGMTTRQVAAIFTIEGCMYSIFAIALAAIYGTPLLYWFGEIGMSMPDTIDGMGVVIGDAIYPSYSISLVIKTIIIVVASATIVSFLPARKIAKMNPVLALKGKVQ